MSRLRRAINFENVLVTLVAFLALSGGVAYAAGHLGKSSVGKKQLKASSVTAAKIKKNAVTAAKIKKGSVTSVKVKDGTIGASAFNPSTGPFSGLIQTTTSTGAGTLSEPQFPEVAQVPLTNNTFTQYSGETISIIGRAHFAGTGKCGAGAKKIVFVSVYYDTPSISSTVPSPPGHLLAEGEVYDTSGTEPASVDIPIVSFENGAISPPAGPTTRTLTMFYGALCESGAGATTSVSNVTLDVIGVR